MFLNGACRRSTSQSPPAVTASQLEITIHGQDGDQGFAPSSLAGLTLEQMLDFDVDTLSVKIDRHHASTKKGLLDHFMEIKVRMMTAQTFAVNEEKRAGGRTPGSEAGGGELAAGGAQDQHHTRHTACRVSGQTPPPLKPVSHADCLWLTAHSPGARGRMLHTQTQDKPHPRQSSASSAYQHSKDRRRGHALLLQVFYSWKQQAMLGKSRGARLVRAQSWYTEVKLQRNVLRSWFREAMHMRTLKLNAQFKVEVDTAKDNIGAMFQAQLDGLRSQLAEARQRLLREAEAREKLEENMKQAFMRGVCALNIEAMSIMKRGMPPGGANPFPTGRPSPQTGEEGRQPGPEALQASPEQVSRSSPTARNAAPSPSYHHHQQQQQQPNAPFAPSGHRPLSPTPPAHCNTPHVSSPTAHAMHMPMPSVPAPGSAGAPPRTVYAHSGAGAGGAHVTSAGAGAGASPHTGGGARTGGVGVTRGPAADMPKPRATAPTPTVRRQQQQQQQQLVQDAGR
ncbi:MAG: hypothetical protein WDW36_005817 [Sanguina aurantia]